VIKSPNQPILNAFSITACLFGALCILACSGPQITSQGSGQNGYAHLVTQSAPYVVLIVNHRKDGQIGYGAGILLDHEGLVLTAWHVLKGARSLKIMRHDPKRPSFSPMAGGLTRYLKDHQDDLHPLFLLEKYESFDLALAKAKIDTSDIALPVFRLNGLQQGEEVLAFGHPQQSVWSFTRGIVSAIHLDTIQHDAPVNTGNSGGPLLDTQGQVVGINTFKLFGQAEGMGFAQPIQRMDKLLSTLNPQTPTAGFDQRTPLRAALACINSWPRESDAERHCVDPEHEWRTAARMACEAVARSRAHKRMVKACNKHVEREAERNVQIGKWRSLYKPIEVKDNKLSLPLSVTFDNITSAASLSRQWAKVFLFYLPPVDMSEEEIYRFRLKQADKLEESNRLLATGMREMARANLRHLEWAKKNKNRLPAQRWLPESLFQGKPTAQRLHQLNQTQAWVQIEVTLSDGSLLVFSKLMVNKDGHWIEHRLPSKAEIKTLPKNWPQPLRSFEDSTEALAFEIMTQRRF
jgi:hypothetical protein